MKRIQIPLWLFAIMLTVVVLSVLHAFGVFDSKDVKKITNERDSIGNQIEHAETRRDKTIETASGNSYKSMDTANQLIKNLPDEKYNIVRDTTDDYMWRKITE